MTAWLLALHILALILWFAALFYLPRLFIYHAYALRQEDEQGAHRFEVMERKLYRLAMNPAMIVTLLLGISLALTNPGYFLGSAWFYVKLVLVVLLIGYHHMCLGLMRRLRSNQGKKPMFYKIFALVPLVITVVVVILSVVQPF